MPTTTDPQVVSEVKHARKEAASVKDDFDKEIIKYAKHMEGCAILTPVKSQRRMEEKVEDDYHGNVDENKDALRAAIVIDGIEKPKERYKAINELRKYFRVIDVTDRFDIPDNEYRDVKINVIFDDVISEVQLHTYSTWQAKMLTYEIYEDLRTATGEREKKLAKAMRKTWKTAYEVYCDLPEKYRPDLIMPEDDGFEVVEYD